MYRLNSYIFKKLFFIFSFSIIVINFIMISGFVFKLLNRGASITNIVNIILLVSPESLAFSMPLSLLIASLLSYSRLSKDNEITAIRSGGINIWQIIFPPLLFSLLISILCFFLHFYFIPNSKYILRTKLKNIGIKNPSILIVPHQYTQLFGKNFIYVDSKQGNKIKGVFIKIFDKKQKITQIVYAKSGSISYNPKNHQINFPLHQVNILNYKYFANSKIPQIIRINAEKWTLNHDIQTQITDQPLLKRAKYLNFNEILARFRIINEDIKNDKMRQHLTFQINKKMVLSLSPLALIMISLAFSLQSGRKDNGYELILIIGLAFGYFIMILIAETIQRNNPNLANTIIWFPNIIYQVIGIINIQKISSI